jgi:hypothetical protein
MLTTSIGSPRRAFVPLPPATASPREEEAKESAGVIWWCMRLGLRGFAHRASSAIGGGGISQQSCAPASENEPKPLVGFRLAAWEAKR